MADIDRTYATDGTICQIYDMDGELCGTVSPKKRIGNKRIDRLVQKAEADQRRAKMGRWK